MEKKPTKLDSLLDAVRTGCAADSDYFTRSEEKLAEKLLSVIESDGSFLKKLTDATLPKESDSSLNYYDHLTRLHYVLGYGHETARVLSHVWISFLLRLPEDSRITFLTRFPENPRSHLFPLLSSLPLVLEQIPVPAAEALPWFLKIREAIGDDMANAGYWLGIDAWTKFNPENAAQILAMIAIETPDDHSISFGARVLANLRALGDKLPAGVKFARLEETLPKSSNYRERILHHRSWSESVLLQKICHDDILQFLQRIEGAETKEITEGFSFIRCLLVRGKAPSKSIEPILGWLSDHASPEADPHWKHMLCIAARAVNEENPSVWSGSQKQRLMDLTIQIQPISAKYQGTWNEIDLLLVSVLKTSPSNASDFLKYFFDANPTGFNEMIDRSNRSRTFFMELAAWPQVSDLMLELFSREMPRRRLALSLINSGIPPELSLDALGKIDEHHLALGVLQLRLDNLLAPQACPLLLQLLPRFEKSSRDVKQLFLEELKYQARNLPGLCLDAFKKTKKPSPLLKMAVSDAENYFQRLRKAGDSPIHAMNVPGLTIARRTLARRRSQTIHKTVQESSPLLQFMKTVHLLYGNEGFASYVDGVLTPPSPFQSHSSSAEMPRLDLMDYDGNKLRRHQTLHLIRSIEAQCHQ